MAKIKMTFLGAAGTVTGSKTLVECSGRKVLIDCGVFQGLKNLRIENWKPLPAGSAEWDAVILTHAHLDHSGALPLLIKSGFQGRIHCTEPTRDIAMIILKDFAKIQEEEANAANRYGYSRHSPAKPLYTMSAVETTADFFTAHPLSQWIPLFTGWKMRFQDAGHILGAAFVELDIHGKRVVFSGDLGREKPLILRPPQSPERADILICESTYGDRIHSKASPLSELARVVQETIQRKGHLLIPAFAVGRAQDLLYLFSKLKAQGMLPDVPIYLDSPMAAEVTEVYYNHPDFHRLKGKALTAIFNVAKRVLSGNESAEITRRKKSSIVIAGSGMVSGGRILGHLEHGVSNAKNTVLLVGFQAPGTRGRQLQEGANEIKIRGVYCPVRAKVENVSVLSAHADQAEILRWMGGMKKKPKAIVLNHGEPQSADVLRVRVRDRMQVEAVVPEMGTEIEFS